MRVIRDLLARDLDQRIEEIIKVDQKNEETVYTEITEYVATDRIKSQYDGLFRAIAEAPADPHEGIGVWISGFFGSGKSSFAKNVGYVLSDQSVLGYSASALFKEQVKDKHITDLVDYINARIPTEIVMFDVSVDRAVKRSTERIAEIMYTVLLRSLGYAEDYDIAELEIELENEGKLEEFIDLCQRGYGDWDRIRKGATKIQKASALLHALDPATFPQPDTWALSHKKVDITVGHFVGRAFDLCAKRRPGKALVFIIDEVGQYVARSGEKIEDLRAVVEQFGKESKNRLKEKRIVAPAWIMVTSQEKLDEVVSALDSKRVELAKLQDRFKYRFDMAPADIREVATRRVLAKTESGVTILEKLYQEVHGQLNTICHLERTTRKSNIAKEAFIQFYPYLPHFIELSIDIVSGIRLQTGANKHIGGSNRTIIKQAYEMLVSDRTAVAELPIGSLVTFDKIFDLVEGNLSSEKQKDISDIRQRFRDDPDDHGMAIRVAKTLCLLEFVSDLPRTESNIAACLVETIDQSSPLPQVRDALEKLRQAQFVRNTEEGWKMQTAQEKSWDTERRTFSPLGKQRNDILRETVQDIVREKAKTYNFRKLRTFRVGVKVDGHLEGDEGQIPLSIYSADDMNGTFTDKIIEIRNESRLDAHKNDLYWVFALNGDIDSLIVEIYASRQMVSKYEQLSAQSRITQEESTSLAHEKSDVIKLQRRLKEKMTQALEQGKGLFRGTTRDADTLGKNFSEIIKKFFDLTVPDLYPKLEMGARNLRGTEAVEVLKAANLSTLPQVFYAGSQGLDLVIKEDMKYVLNPSADIAKEVLDYLKHEHAYGNKVTGKNLEEHFLGIGYGWDRDVLRLVIAALLRAGSIEIVYQGRRFRNHQDPLCRTPIENNTAFKAASFAPRESVGLKTLTTAVVQFEELTGEDVDIEEGAIATALKKVADEEVRQLLPVIALAKANDLPLSDVLTDYHHTLENILVSASDDCVRLLAGEGESFKRARDTTRKIRLDLNDEGLATIRRARLAITMMWPELELRAAHEFDEKVSQLRSLLQSPYVFEKLATIEKFAQEIVTAYGQCYLEVHQKRATVFSQAIDEIKGRSEWNVQLDFVLAPLLSRACKIYDEKNPEDILPHDAVQCRYCHASLGQIDSDLAAVEGLQRQVIARIQELTASKMEPGQRVERIRLLDFFDQVLETEEAVDEAINELRDFLHKKIAEGSRIIME